MSVVEPEPGRVDQDGPVVGVSVTKRRRWNRRNRIVQRPNEVQTTNQNHH